jgi:hypothetical protein
MLQACHFVIHVGQRAIEICDALIDIAVRHSWPPSCPAHYKNYVSIYNREREREEKRKREEEARQRRKQQQRPDNADFIADTGDDDGEVDSWPANRRRSRSFSAISSSSSFSAWASSTRDKMIEETVKSCGVCRGQLEMENPEIFKIIIQLLASAQGRTDDRDICYILNKLTFLATLSPSNQHQIAGVEVVCELLDHFRGILTAGNLSTLTSTADAAARAAHASGDGGAVVTPGNTKAFLHSTVLRFVAKIASHSVSLQALRKYLKLMKDPADFPVSLLSTLVSIAKRFGSCATTIAWRRSAIDEACVLCCAMQGRACGAVVLLGLLQQQGGSDAALDRGQGHLASAGGVHHRLLAQSDGRRRWRTRPVVEPRQQAVEGRPRQVRLREPRHQHRLEGAQGGRRGHAHLHAQQRQQAVSHRGKRRAYSVTTSCCRPD